MGDFNGRVYQVAADGNKNQMLLADIDSDTRDAYQSKLSAVMKEVYRLLSIGAGESDFSNVLLVPMKSRTVFRNQLTAMMMWKQFRLTLTRKPSAHLLRQLR